MTYSARKKRSWGFLERLYTRLEVVFRPKDLVFLGSGAPGTLMLCIDRRNPCPRSILDAL